MLLCCAEPGTPLLISPYLHSSIHAYIYQDVALQLLGNLFEYFLAKRQDGHLTILGATSGDTGASVTPLYLCRSRPVCTAASVARAHKCMHPTHLTPPPFASGSAAIYGLRGKANVRCFILYPKGRTSAIQERQMTTVRFK